jgi:broad specificity phosphatase PhoE
MRYLEVRRHTMRTRPGKHLSQAGVTLARAVGGQIGPFDRVVTSGLPRAFETAIAMWFAVDEQIEDLGSMPGGVDREVDWSDGFPAFAAAVARGKATAKYARALAGVFREIVTAVPDGGAALVISHGGIIEAGTVGCLPDADHAAWGRALDYCEGVRLSFDGDAFTGVEILRLRRETPIDERVLPRPA